MYSDLRKISEYVEKIWPNLDPVSGQHQAKVMELYRDPTFRLTGMSQGIEVIGNTQAEINNYWNQ